MSTTMGELRYDVVEGWEQLPSGFHHGDVCGVAVDSADRLFVVTRREPRVIVYDRDGTFLRSWGETLFSERPHGLTIAPDDTLYVVEEPRHAVYHLTPDGTVLDTIGTLDTPSDSGYTGELTSVTHGGGPFNRPTNLAIAPNGDLYISDGYGNTRVHHFTAAGELVRSWGEPGSGPGQFRLPHGIAVTHDGRVLLADRENDRIQVFGPDGEYLTEWQDVQRPTNVEVARDGKVYVSELWRKPGDESYRLGTTTEDRPGRVSIYDEQGTLLARWGADQDRTAAGNFIAPHDVVADSRGDVYVGEVTWTVGVSNGSIPEGSHSLQKFALRRA